jgi:hypothetical protein
MLLPFHSSLHLFRRDLQHGFALAIVCEFHLEPFGVTVGITVTLHSIDLVDFLSI